jgi:hypothetical protein
MNKLIVLLMFISSVSFSMSKKSAPKKRVEIKITSEAIIGKDEDQNGVPDDVDSWIANLSYSSNIKRALNQMAKARIKGLIEHESKAKSNDNSHLLEKAIICTSSFFLSDEEYMNFSSLFKSQKSLILNTKVRIRANYIYNNNLNGTSGHPDFGQVESIEIRRKKACDFKIE